jgi:AhpD family alkylhydroperoxidase
MAITVGELNGCEYCVAAHAALGKMVGLGDEEIADSRRGVSPDRKTEAALQFARKIVQERGFVSDGDVAGLREVGYGDGEIVEIVADVGLNVFTNYFNHVVDTEIDFPEVKPLPKGGSCSCG